MNAQDQLRFDAAYHQLLTALKLQGKAPKPSKPMPSPYADSRSMSIASRRPHHRRTQSYFSDLIDSHSWSAVKIDRNGIRFFYQHVLGRHSPGST